MNLSNPSTYLNAIDRIKQEIEKLSSAHSEALQKATYLGMTPDEARMSEDRRIRLTQLKQQLALMGQPR